MTDIEIFKKFMSWMQLEVSNEKVLENGNIVLIFSQNIKDKELFKLFNTCGYDEFEAGIMFDKEGTMMKGYMDSHVTYSSDNCKSLLKLLKC